MAKTIYKQTTLENAKNRPSTPLNTVRKAEAFLIVSKFITHLKNKHS